MAQAIGYVKYFENGTFYVRDAKGNFHQLKAGETINEGDHVYGAYNNGSNAKIVIDVLLEGAGDLVLGGDAALQFDGALLANIFSDHDAVIHVNSLNESLALTAASEAQIQSAEETVMADATEAGDETAAGDALTDTERLVDTFAARTGGITDVTTDLRSTVPGTREVAVEQSEVSLLEKSDNVPVAVSDAITTTEKTAVTGNLAGNDIPSADGGNVWTLTEGTQNGTVVVNPDGTFTYTPNEGYNGPDSFTYTLTDSDGDTSTATVTIDVTAVNDGPTIDVIAYQSFTEGSATAGDIAFTFTASDPDTPSEQLSYVLTNNSNGYLALGTGNTVVLTEAGAAAINTDNTIVSSLTATVQVSDGSLTAADSDVTSVSPVNDNEGLVLSTDTLNVAEAGLSPFGIHAAGPSEIAYGAFTVFDPDGLDDIKSLTIGGTTYTIGEGGIDSLSEIVGQSVDTGYGKITIMNYDNGVFDYKYVLDQNVDNAIQGATDTSYIEKFTVSVSDGTGGAASQDVSVVISDDVSLGSADSGIVANSVDATLTGDAGIVFGADGAAASPYSISVSTMPMGWASRVVNGEIYLWGPGDSVPDSGSDGATAKFALDNGEYTFTVLQELETTITPIPLSLTTLAPAGQPTAEKFVTDITLPNGDPLRITIHGTGDALVNSSNDGLGVDNPQVDAGEQIYFDFSKSIADFTVNIGNFAHNDTLLWTAYSYDTATSDYVPVATGSYDATATNNSVITPVILSQSMDDGSLMDGFDRIVFGAEVDSDHQVDDYNMMSAIVGVSETEVPNDASFVFSVAGMDSDGDSAISYIGVNIDANDIQGGGAGDDVLSGGGVLIGGGGDDTLTGDETAGYLFGGEDNDTLSFDATDHAIDGGAGTDTLILVGDTDIDFDAWESGSLKSIEVIDLTDGNHDLTNLSLNDVVNMTDSNNDIYILGDTGDKVDFLDSNGWEISTVTPTVTQNINGVDYTFDVYINGDDPTVTVHVEQAITDSILP